MTEVTSPPPVAREHCRHYSYDLRNYDDWSLGGPRCALGIDLSAPGGSRRCWPNSEQICASRENWTEQEKATWKAWQDERNSRMIAAIAALPASEGYSTTTINCPSCSGTIKNIRIPKRAHVECSTPHCVKFEANVRGLWPGKSA